MQRQSLGSPSSKLVKNEQHLITTSETHNQLPSSSSISTINGDDQCKHKADEFKKKLHRVLKTTMPMPMPETYIHLIPMLTLLCFLILYLSSHHPSQNDMAQFNGFKTFSNPTDSEDSISELETIAEIKKSDILAAIRSLKNLNDHEEEVEEEADTPKHRRLHRKIPQF
ncbi:hypothetical protein BUALT_Bualt05G0085200 [Buddleja alternifolia]|uniref:Transmembrane protein n=1 Tax=Buddleja alternifolia TaxID=168488 RepID=A0AAV6XHS1_9LAMI|nr:hypothetical protein BUALT_Bualt05G0085200 [Buddleja alternifolia]